LYGTTFCIAGQFSVTLASGVDVIAVRSGNVTLSGSDGSVSPFGSEASLFARTPVMR
jgi:hypothetical protein